MKRMTLALVFGALLALAATPALAEHADLMRAHEKFTEMVNDGITDDLLKHVDFYRVAGLSYQPSLTVPLEGVLNCKDEEALRTLYGMYQFDANYALAFGIGSMALKTKNLIREELLPKLDVSAQLELEPASHMLMKRLQEDPNDPQTRSQFIAEANINFKRIAELSADEKVMELVVDSLYGFVTEGLYVACTLAKGSEMTPEMINMFMDQLEHFKIFDNLMHTFEDETCLSFIEMADRDGLLHTVIDRISETKGRLTPEDLDSFLAMIGPERAKLAQRCN